MESDLDPFIDILPEPTVTNARAGGKFQPKAKPRPRKESSTSVPSSLPDVAKEVSTSDDHRSSELAKPMSQLVVTREDLGSTNALPSEVAISGSNSDWHSSLGKSAGEADSMGFDLDPFADFLPDPVISNAGASSKFLPKAKPQPRKDASASVHSALPNAEEEKPDSLVFTGSDTTQSVKPVDVSDNRLTDPLGSSSANSEIFGTKEPLKDNEGSFPVANRSLGLVNLSFQLGAIKEDEGSRDALRSGVAISDSNGNWHSSFRKFAGETDSMGFDLDPFAEVLPEPAASNSRVGGNFQPKAKPCPIKETSASVTSATSNVTKDKLAELASAGSGTMQFTQSVSIADNRLADLVGLSLATSQIHGSKDSLDNSEGSFLGVPFSDNDGSLGLVEPSSHTVTVDALQSEVALADGNGDWHSSLRKSAGENADIFSELEYLDDFLSQSTTSGVSAASKSQPNIETNALVRNKFLMSNPFDTDGGGSLCPSETPTLHASNSKDTEGDTGVPVLSSIYSSFPELSTAQDPVTCGEAAVPNNDIDFQIDNGRLETEEAGPFPALETLDIMSEATITSGRRSSKFLPKPKVQRKKEKPMASSSDADAVESVMCPPDAQLVHSETEDMDEGSFPAFPSDDPLDFSSVRFSDSIPTNPTSELLVSKEPTNLADTCHLDAAIPEDVGHSEAAPEMSGKASAQSRKRKTSTISDVSQKLEKSSTAGGENEYGESSRHLRNRRAAHDLVNGSEDGANDDGGFPAEPHSNSVLNGDENNDDEYRVEDTPRKKRAPRKCKNPVAENEKPVQKRKKANEVPDQASKETPKKFSHSTRRNRRRVDKALLETPEDEIDIQKLPIKDLILLAEFRERISNKEATVSKTPLTNQSADNYFHGDAPDNEEIFASDQDRDSNDDQANIRVQPSSSYFNYQSYMNKSRSARWSKQDTELFYEGVRQFGTDFAMVQQLFPGRTRNQIKLKYKKEERQHPLRLSEAVKNRAKDHSHFELVIERLQQTAQAEQDSNGDDSIAMTGEEEEEAAVGDEATAETNEAPKSEQNEEVAAEEQDADAADVHSPMKFDESDDDLQRWSQYKSEW